MLNTSLQLFIVSTPEPLDSLLIDSEFSSHNSNFLNAIDPNTAANEFE